MRPLLTTVFALAFAMLSASSPYRADADSESVYLTEDEAVAAVLGEEADRFERRRIDSTQRLRASIEMGMARAKPTVWEPAYSVTTGYAGDTMLGHAVIVEEIGKHRSITFAVGVGIDGRVTGVALMVYREAYGAEVRSRRFLTQYNGKTGAEHLLPGRDVRNITGATLSVQAIGRGVKKAVVVAAAAREQSAESQQPGDDVTTAAALPRDASGEHETANAASMPAE